jgi:hypothetical protein
MNNYSAIGFMIMAAKQFGLNDHTIGVLEYEMKKAMNEKSEEEAIEVYKSF